MGERGPEEYSTAWGNRSPVMDAATAAPASPAPSFPAPSAPPTPPATPATPKEPAPTAWGVSSGTMAANGPGPPGRESSATTASSDNMIMAQAEEALKALQMLGIVPPIYGQVNCRIRQAVNG
jgi:hypothetical protein